MRSAGAHAPSPHEVIPVGTEASGKVIEVAADFNQIVSEGDLLVRLDDRAADPRERHALRPASDGSGDARAVGAGYAALGTAQPA